MKYSKLIFHKVVQEVFYFHPFAYKKMNDERQAARVEFYVKKSDIFYRF